MPLHTPLPITAFNRNILPLFDRATHGNRIMSDVAKIVETDRWNSFDRFHDTTNTLVESYRASGAKTEVYAIPTGGPVGSGRWIIPKAADIRSAALDVVRPIAQRILTYKDNPWHIVQWSAATPPEGIECNLVVIDDEKALAALKPGSLNHKLALTRLNVRTHMKTFADKGAIGVLTDYPVPDLPNATPWTKFGWGGIPLPHAPVTLVGMVLSETEGKKLRTLVQAHGALTVRVCADIHHYAGTHDLVSGIIAGQDDPQDEVWALAHSAEPGAIDNASGVALCLEMARVIETLMTQGKLPRPKRTIRLLSGYECYSFFHYAEYTRRFQTPLAGACIDTVGARPDICGGQLSWRATIPMSAGFADRVGAAILRAALRRTKPGYTLVEGPFVSTSDTLLGDPKCGFPCPWITTHYRKNGKTWKAYHTSADVPDLLSPTGLKACATGMAAYLYYLANAGTDDALALATSETQRTCAHLSAEKSPETAAYMREQHHTSLTRLQRWLWEGDRTASLRHFNACETEVRNTGPRPPHKRSPKGTNRIPHRIAPLSPTSENTPAPIADRIKKSGLPAWALFWADGRRTLFDITRLLSVEHGKPISPDQVAGYFEAHEALGYVRLIAPEAVISKAQLVADLKTLGLQPGMDVIVHSSLSRIGHVAGGADAVIDAILKIIGKTGTLLMPSFNHRRAYLFNPQTTPTTNGAIPDAFWRRPNAVRSLHPTHAWAAIGPKAEWLCTDHLTTGVWTAESPLSRFIHSGGYILSLGVDHNSSTAYHAAEVSMPCGCIDPFGNTDRALINGMPQDVPGLAFRGGACPVPPEKLNTALKNRQNVGKVGQAEATLVKAIDLWHARRRHLKNACPTCPVKPRYAPA